MRIHRIICLLLVLGAPVWAQINYPDFSSVAGLNMNGSTVQVGNRLRLTTNVEGQLGTAWYNTKQYIQNGFQTKFQFQITDTGYSDAARYQTGGDGISFTIQNDNATIVGDQIQGITDMGYAGIINCVSIEFDMYYNPERGDPDGNHVSIHTNGTGQNSDYESYSIGRVTPSFSMHDGNIHTVKIDYNVVPGKLRVFMDDTVNVLLVVPLDLTNFNGGDILDNGTAWVGFTGGTGAAYENQDILNWTLAPLISQANSYIIPDIGAPDMNTYMEIVGPYNQDGNFGSDGFYMNNPGDAVRVMCASDADTDKIKFGPAEVSWNGKLISTQIFVMPDQQPNSSDWRQLAPSFKIPLKVSVGGGETILTDTFYIVQPQPAIVSPTPGVIGSGGSWGYRSKRGAMIVDSMVLNGTGIYTIDTSDCDSTTPGNQGFLPVTILSKGAIAISPTARLSVDGNGMNGGPGGGGGGGIYVDLTAGTSTVGGSGYTGGEGGTMQGGWGSGGSGADSGWGGESLNGLPGGVEKPGAFAYYISFPEWHPTLGGGQGTGGGSGFPFGSSGEGGYTDQCVFNNSIGGYSGGSGASECSNYNNVGAQNGVAFGGSGGGNATAGTSSTSGGGLTSGNGMIVPLSGGSGGSGGNPWQGVPGYGGGGGGAIELYGVNSIQNISVSSVGVKGGDMTQQNTQGDYSGAGGGGSGGGIIIASKQSLSVDTASADGGQGGVATVVVPGGGPPVQNGGDGGAGRVRTDGPMSVPPVVVPILASQYRGPSTDTSQYVARTFMLTGTGNGQPVNIYIKSEAGAWQLATTISNYPSNPWSQTITLPGNDSLYFLVAAQQVPNPSIAQYTIEPSWVFSQSAANILRISQRNPMITVSAVSFNTLTCDTVTYSNVTISNTGTDTLRINSISITQDNEGFSLVPSPVLPIIIPPGKDTNITIQFAPVTSGSKTAVLNVYSNATNTPVLTLSLSGQRNSISPVAVTVSVTADSGKPGDTVYLPVIARSQQQTVLSGVGYTARVRYDGSILLPVGMRNATIDSIGNGYVVFTCNNAADTVILICIVGLGDTTGTSINIDTVAWGGCTIQSTSVNGVFQLAGLCTQGGTRLFLANGSLTLSQNVPNPFTGETEIRYSTIEDGETELFITDVLGRRVITLTSGYRKAGEYTAVLRGDGLRSGIYYYALQTPTQILRKTMIVEK